MPEQGIIPKGANFIPVMGAVSSATDTGASSRPLQYDPTSRGLTVHIVGDDAFGLGTPSLDSYGDADIDVSADTANQVLISSAANKQIWVYGIQFTVGTADGTVSFQDEDDTALTGVMEFAQKSGWGLPPNGNLAMPLWKLGTNKDLEVDTVTCSIEGSIQYGIVDVS